MMNSVFKCKQSEQSLLRLKARLPALFQVPIAASSVFLLPNRNLVVPRVIAVPTLTLFTKILHRLRSSAMFVSCLDQWFIGEF